MFKPFTAIGAFIKYRNEKKAEREKRDHALHPSLDLREKLLKEVYEKQPQPQTSLAYPLAGMTAEEQDQAITEYQLKRMDKAEEELNNSGNPAWESINRAIVSDWKQYYIAEDIALEGALNTMKKNGLGFVTESIKKTENLITDFQCFFDNNRAKGRSQMKQLRYLDNVGTTRAPD